MLSIWTSLKFCWLVKVKPTFCQSLTQMFDGVCGPEVEHWPRNLEVQSSISGAGVNF